MFREVNRLLGSQHLRTTAYHPASIGLIERMYRPIKTAIKCRATGSWTEVLPIVFLVIGSSWREDYKSIAAELLYGETSGLPGEFLTPPETCGHHGLSEFVQNLRRHFQNLGPVSDCRHGVKKTFVLKLDLPSA